MGKVSKKLIVFGAGYNFIKNVEQLEREYEIVALTDNDKQKWNQMIGGHLCYNPANALEFDYDSILIASVNAQVIKEIEMQLRDLGNGKEILSLNEYNICDFCWNDSKYPSYYKDDFGNEIIFEEGVQFRRIHFYIAGCNNTIIVKRNVTVVVNLDIYMGGNENCLEIGERTSFVSSHIDIAEKGIVKIGKDCMISADVDIYQSATHPIFEIHSGQRINLSKDIFIGDHVWIGKRVGLMSGFRVGDGSIVGYGSVSSRVFENNVTIAGNPAKILHKNVEWRKDGLGFYKLDNIEESKTER